MVEWNGIFRLFRFSGILGQPREIHIKFRNEIPENVCSIRSQTLNFRKFWSNGKRPISQLIIYGNEEEHIKAVTSCVPLVTFGSERIYLLLIFTETGSMREQNTSKKKAS